MKILLIKSVSGIGNKGDIIDVSNGYARNYLLPNKIGVLATKKHIDDYEKIKEKKKEIENKRYNLISELAKKIDNLEVSISVSSGKSGEVFNSVHKDDVLEKIFELVSKEDNENILDKGDIKIDMEKPIKELGEFKLYVTLGRGNNKKKASINLKIVPEKK